jgi:hypothetical protein
MILLYFIIGIYGKKKVISQRAYDYIFHLFKYSIEQADKISGDKNHSYPKSTQSPVKIQLAFIQFSSFYSAQFICEN